MWYLFKDSSDFSAYVGIKLAKLISDHLNEEHRITPGFCTVIVNITYDV